MKDPSMSEECEPSDTSTQECGEKNKDESCEESEIQALLDEALNEKSQFRAMAQRAQADLENYKKRALKERDELRISTNETLLIKILSVIDDLERAMELIPQDSVAPGWLDGLSLVIRNLVGILDSENIQKIDALGLPFNPWEFEAIQYQESEETEDGNILKVLRDGYKRNDKIIRAAQVVVAKKPEDKINSENEEEDLS